MYASIDQIIGTNTFLMYDPVTDTTTPNPSSGTNFALDNSTIVYVGGVNSTYRCACSMIAHFTLLISFSSSELTMFLNGANPSLSKYFNSP